MTAGGWPPSIHPAARGHSWNTLLDCVADAYRALQPGEHVMSVLVVVKDGQGRSTTIVRDQDGTRRVCSEDTGCEGAA
jgi:hypothetical protein